MLVCIFEDENEVKNRRQNFEEERISGKSSRRRRMKENITS